MTDPNSIQAVSNHYNRTLFWFDDCNNKLCHLPERGMMAIIMIYASSNHININIKRTLSLAALSPRTIKLQQVSSWTREYLTHWKLILEGSRWRGNLIYEKKLTSLLVALIFAYSSLILLFISKMFYRTCKSSWNLTIVRVKLDEGNTIS